MSKTDRGTSGAKGRRARQAAALRRRRARIRWGVGATALLVALLVVLVTLPSGGDDTVSASGRATIGGRTPNIEMVDFDGAAFSLQDYEGTPLVLNFWASWCPFCIGEMPDFERVHQRLGDDVEFLGVNLQDDHSEAVKLVGETGITYRVAADPSGVIYGAFGGTGMPTTVLIDSQGVVREVVTGQMSESQLLEKIEQNFQISL